jgi:hypothetical protein
MKKILLLILLNIAFKANAQQALIDPYNTSPSYLAWVTANMDAEAYHHCLTQITGMNENFVLPRMATYLEHYLGMSNEEDQTKFLYFNPKDSSAIVSYRYTESVSISKIPHYVYIKYTSKHKKGIDIITNCTITGWSSLVYKMYIDYWTNQSVEQSELKSGEMVYSRFLADRIGFRFISPDQAMIIVTPAP